MRHSEHFFCFFAGIILKGFPILHYVNCNASILQGQDFIIVRCKDRLDLRDLMRIVGCDNKPHSSFSPSLK